MRKIYLKESSISSVLNKRLLPQFLFKLVKTHTTSLGDNEAFPIGEDYPFDYIILKERYNEVCDNIERLNLESLDEDYLMSELSSLIKRCKELETPIRDTLEKICENSVNRLFAIPSETINMTFKLVDKIKFKKSVRMKPESNGDIQYTFKDIQDIDFSNKSISKRRFINSLIQGASYLYSGIEGLYINDIDRINQELPRLYRRVRIINDYLLFIKKEEMSDDKPMQGSYVETHLGSDISKTTIKAQGLIFPLLLQEAIKGLFELFSSHGLPSDIKKAQYIIKKADFILAEPWDLRFGTMLWKMLFGNIENTNMIPYVFTSLVKMPTDEFNISVKEILSKTEKGNEIINALIKNAEYDRGYQEFTNRINAKNINKSLISDSYFNGAETNGYEIGSDTDDGDVIEEYGGSYSKDYATHNSEIEGILANATVDDIDFIEGNIGNYGEEVFLSVDGVEIPREFVCLDFRPIYKRFPTGKHQLLNIDINIAPQVRRIGLGTKIYAKAVREFGAICSRHSTRHNDKGIRGIFKKLETFNDIKVIYDDYENIEREPISDYYAILKTELNKYFGEEVNENFNEYKLQLITESQESKSIVQAKALVMKRLGYDSEQADDFIRIKLRNDIPSLRTPQGGKFILGVTRMFCDGELRDANIIGNLDKTIKLVSSDAHINEYDRNLNGMSAQDLISRFEGARGEMLDADMKNLSSMGFQANNDYDIVRIDSFEQSMQYGDYTSWCVTHDENMFDSYTNDGINQFYFCLKHGFEGVKRVQSDGCPLDEYGLSMIAVSVDGNGALSTCTCRWNHDNGGNDGIMDTKQISTVIGTNFYNVFKPNNKWKMTLSSAMERLSNGEPLESVFDEAHRLKNGLTLVRLSDKCNFVNQEGRIISNQWFDYVADFNEGFAIVHLNKKWNFISQEGRLLSSKWFDYACGFYEGFGIVKLKHKYNFINQEGRIISNQWFGYAYDFKEGFARVYLNEKYNFINKEGRTISDQWFDYVDDFDEGFARVELNGKWNFISQEGRIISNQWFDYAYDFKEGFARVRLNGEWSLIGTNGHIVQNESKGSSKKVYINEDKLMILTESLNKHSILFEDKRTDQARARCKEVIRRYFKNASWLDTVFDHQDNPQGMTYLDYMFYHFEEEFYHNPNLRKGATMRLEPLFCRLAFENGFQQQTPNVQNLQRLSAILNLLYNLSKKGEVNLAKIDIVNTTFDQLNEEFGKIIDDENNSEMQSINNMDFHKNNDYTVVGPLDYETANEIGNYSNPDGRLCYTQSQSTWDKYTQNGCNNVYVILKDGWKGIDAVHDDESNSAYDTYGLSMVFVFVDENGELVYCNTRWNHDAEYKDGFNVDHAMSKMDISNLIGANFYSVFKPNNKWKITLSSAMERLANGEPLKDIFDGASRLKNGLTIVLLSGKWNFINEEGELISDKWFDSVGKFNEGFAKVKVNDKCNFINQEGRTISNQWFDNASYFKEGFARVYLNGKCNFINQESRIISNQWFDYAYDFYEGFARVELNGKWNFINQESRIISNQWFDYAFDFYEGFANVKLNHKYNFINQEGRIISNQWFDEASYFYEGFAKVELNGNIYKLDTSGNLVA